MILVNIVHTIQFRKGGLKGDGERKNDLDLDLILLKVKRYAFS